MTVDAMLPAAHSATVLAGETRSVFFSDLGPRYSRLSGGVPSADAGPVGS